MFYMICLSPGAEPGLSEDGVFKCEIAAKAETAAQNELAERYRWPSRYEVRDNLTGVFIDHDVRSSLDDWQLAAIPPRSVVINEAQWAAHCQRNG